MKAILSVYAWRTGVVRFGISAGVIILAGCVSVPSEATRQLLTSVPATALAEVESTAASGQAAAEAYLELARNTQAPGRQALELRAAESFYQAGQSLRALRTLGGIDSGQLTAGARNHEHLIAARAALQASLPERALTELKQLSRSSLPPDLRIEHLGLMAAAYRHQDDPVQAAKTLDELDRLLGDPQQRLDTQVSLLLTLSTLPNARLRTLASGGSGNLRAWASLAELLAGHEQADAALEGRYRAWRSSHGRLPVKDDLPQAYYAALAGAYTPGTEVWVLLPSSGRFSGASQAVHNGLRHADQLNHSGHRAQLQAANSAANAGAAYERATAAGADLIIGPLQKPAVNALSEQQSRLPVPTLALNQNTNGYSLPEQLYQFALAPEDEAISAANHAWASKLRSALLLYPNGAWGNRLASAFRQHWRALGGTIAGEAVYGNTPASMGTSLDTLLAPGTGELIFMVATNSSSRALWSQVLAANTRQLPVLATSHVYSGQPDDARALSGLYFVDIPWLLDPNSGPVRVMQPPAMSSGGASATLARLQAMGVDSYRLAPRSAVMAGNSGHFFPGVSGGLSFDGTGRVQRTLPLGRFEASGPVPVAGIQAAAATAKASDAALARR
ncbi:penicillin-binding protein activator [Rhabdochromatium marinum]|uniref:penicillin-binding protein activator n=1 Tax=Rhabdochromatium marinum TaxID=48729 RepID=UPI001902C737|nr:penicillin-binding protein activator [Rhabdochromatium marinum]MBK1647410.1 hypothetical protein [Rhabdochromatium marinum]